MPRFASAAWHNVKYGFCQRVTPAGNAAILKSRCSNSAALDMNAVEACKSDAARAIRSTRILVAPTQWNG